MTAEHISLIIGAAGFLLSLHFAPAIVLAFVLGYAFCAALRRPKP